MKELNIGERKPKNNDGKHYFGSGHYETQFAVELHIVRENEEIGQSAE